jgi:hypothetical protein
MIDILSTSVLATLLGLVIVIGYYVADAFR